MGGPSLDQLQTFLDVVRLGSFSAAARRRGITQPAISLQLRQLESRLGVKLIERIGRRMRATAAGAELVPYAEKIEATLQSAFDAMALHASDGLGRVRIGTGGTASIFLLPPALRDLRKRFPALEIIVTVGNSTEIASAVEDNLLDLGVVTLPVAGRALDVRPLVDDAFVAVAAAETRLPAVTTPQELLTEPLLLFEPGGNTRRLVDDWFAGAGVMVKPAMALGSVEAIKELVAAGLGRAILPQLAMCEAVEDGGRFAVSPLSPPLQRTLALVMRHDKRLHKGLRETVKALDGLRQAR